jgi:hypothetical protein
VVADNGVLECFALDEAHGVERPAVGILAKAVDRHDAGMFQTTGDLGLADETAAAMQVGGVAFLDLLERYLAIQLLVQGHKHLADAALVVRTENLISLPGGWLHF